MSFDLLNRGFFGNSPEANAVNVMLKAKKYFEQYRINVPFFVAGGSIFSTLNGCDSYDDIDVYFYNEKDWKETFIKLPKEHQRYSSDNAVTFYTDNTSIKIQLIKMHFGTPQEIFDGFDLNCSKCAVTSDHEIIKDKTCSKYLSVDFNNFKANTLRRVQKYIDYKGAHEEDSLQSVLAYLIKNYDKKFDRYYAGNNESFGSLDILNPALYKMQHDKELLQKVHDVVVKLYDSETRMDIFKKLYSLQNIGNRSDELIANEIMHYEIMHYENDCFSFDNKPVKYTKIPESEIQRIKIKFAEYFI